MVQHNLLQDRTQPFLNALADDIFDTAPRRRAVPYQTLCYVWQCGQMNEAMLPVRIFWTSVPHVGHDLPSRYPTRNSMKRPGWLYRSFSKARPPNSSACPSCERITA